MRRLGPLAALVLLAATLALPVAAHAQEAGNPPPTPTEGECVVCHAVPEVVVTGSVANPDLLVTREQVDASVHHDLACTDCHSPLTGTLHPANDRAPTSCQECHEDAATQYAAGAHGQVSEAGPRPTCTTCHTAHDVVATDTPGFDDQVALRCAACHSAMSDRAFGANPLGLETHLGRIDVATCDDCHEPHEVLPASDPNSSVSPRNKLATCRQCHQNAPPNFKDIEIHVASGPLPDDFKLRIATLWMLVILIFTFAFFGWLTILGIRHEWRHSRRGPGQETPS